MPQSAETHLPNVDYNFANLPSLVEFIDGAALIA
jgi:hypothetical protein